MKKKNIRDISIGSITIFFIVIILSACGSNNATEIQKTVQAAVNQTVTVMPTFTPLPTAQPVEATALAEGVIPVQYGPTNFPENINPLTGLPVDDPTILQRRPVMIKVSNFPREGRPHAGLSKADIVFDYSVGEGGNRFLALFYGQDSENVGPVRSGRMVDRWLVSMYQGILGMKLAYEDVLDTIDNQLGYDRVINAAYNSCPAICQIDANMSEISWFANSAEMTKRYETKSGESNFTPDLEGMAFNSIPPEGGVDGHDFTMHFGKANEGQWIYDSATRKYNRWIENMLSVDVYNMIPLVDRNTGEQLAFSNVIVMFAPYETLNNIDTIHEIDLLGGSGKMMLFRDGQLYTGTWKAIRYDTPLRFYDNDGEIIELQPGNTWISITGAYSSVQEVNPGVWLVKFAKP